MDVAVDVIADQRRQGRRRQDLAARQGQGDRDAAPPAAGRAHVHRRRLQLRRADRGRRAGLFRRAARHFRRDRAGRLGGARRVRRAATWRRSTTSWRRRCRCRATSSRRRPASTRPASCSWPISTACRIISPWSAARRARARPCISPSCSVSPTPRACCADPERAARAHAHRAWRRAAWRLMRDLSKDPTLLAINSATVKAWTLRATGRRLRARGITAIAPWRDIVQAAGIDKAGKLIRDARADVSCLCRGGMFPAADEAGAPCRARRQPPRGRRGRRHRREVPGADRGRFAERIEGSRRRARAGARRHRGAAALCARRRHAARDRAAASDVPPPTAPA